MTCRTSRWPTVRRRLTVRFRWPGSASRRSCRRSSCWLRADCSCRHSIRRACCCPWQDGQATLQVSGEHLLVRSGAIGGSVQWHGGRAVQSCRRWACLRQAGVQAVQWIGKRTAWRWPAGHRRHEGTAGMWPSAGWSLPLPGAGRQAPRLAIGLALAAVLLARSACSCRSGVGGSRARRCNRTWRGSSAHASRRSPMWWIRCCRQGVLWRCRHQRHRCRR